MIQRATSPEPTLLLDAAAVRRTLEPTALVAAVESSLLALDDGAVAVAPTVHLAGDDGGFHVKSAAGAASPRRAALKFNGNFPMNPARFGLPTIQGLLALLDLERGGVLALMDSASITALRTAAVSAVAARRLVRRDARRLALVGCGVQGEAHLAFLCADHPFTEIRLVDRDRAAADRLARAAAAHGATVSIVESVAAAADGADVVVTTTPATAPILFAGDVAPGAFVAAVGADNPTKCELAPALLASARVVVDSFASASTGGDLRAALEVGALRPEDVHGELPALLAGRVAGRSSPAERFVFDSTGLAATDLAAASLAYDAARGDAGLPRFHFAAPERSAP